MRGVLRAIPKDTPYGTFVRFEFFQLILIDEFVGYLSRLIDTTRLQLSDIATQYRAVFSDESLPDSNSSSAVTVKNELFASIGG